MYVVFDMNDFVLRKYNHSVSYSLEHRYTSRRSAQDVVNSHDVGITTQLPLANEKRLVCLSEIFTLVRILLTTQHVKKAIEKSAWLNVAVLEFIKRGANHLDISLNNFKGEEDAETQIIIQHLVEDFCSILQVGTFDPTKWTLATRHAVWYVVFERKVRECQMYRSLVS